MSEQDGFTHDIKRKAVFSLQHDTKDRGWDMNGSSGRALFVAAAASLKSFYHERKALPFVACTSPHDHLGFDLYFPGKDC